jgi:multisubunit Na+/H+ antiporter MnhG subunit
VALKVAGAKIGKHQNLGEEVQNNPPIAMSVMRRVKTLNRLAMFLKDHWRGDLSLRMSFWVNGSFAAVFVGLLTSRYLHDPDFSELQSNTWLYSMQAITAISVTISLWCMIGIWRSSSSYQRAGGNVIFHVAAKLLMIAGAVSLAYHVERKSPPLFEASLLMIGIDPLGTAPELTVNGRTLHINGTITAGTGERFLTLINEHPKVDQISLTSAGGRLKTAAEIGSLIEKRNLSTIAVGECTSACTLIFFSSKNRALDVDASLGFHSPSGGAAGDVVVNGVSRDLRLAYVAAGLPDAFVEKAFWTPSDAVWYPSDEELIDAGAVNSYTKARIHQEHAQRIKSFKETAPLKIDERTSVVSAEAYGVNITYTYVITSWRADELDWLGISKEADTLICGDVVSKLFVKSGAKYSHLYLDENGKKVGIVMVEKCSSKN